MANSLAPETPVWESRESVSWERGRVAWTRPMAVVSVAWARDGRLPELPVPQARMLDAGASIRPAEGMRASRSSIRTPRHRRLL
jgi:hypothetical protein